MKRKKDKKGGNEMNGLKRKEEVNELDEHIETKPSGSNVAPI